MSTLPMKTEIENRISVRGASDPLESGSAVVFRGDGEPKSTRSFLLQLADIESDVGLDPDTYSLGGSVAALESHFAAALGKESAIFMPTGTLANHLAIRALCVPRLE